MYLTLILAIIAGVVGSVVTIWGSVSAPSSFEGKVFFVFIGVVGVAALVASTILNSRSQDQMGRQVLGLRTDIQGLAKLAEADPNANPNQILAATAAKLIEQDKRIRQLEPRHLSLEQAEKMTAVAKQTCPDLKRVLVTAANGNQEAQAYGSSFVNVFKAAGCVSDLALPIPGLKPDVQGVRIGVRNLADIPKEVQMVAQVLSSGGVAYQVNPLTPEFFAGEPFVLIVGAKPAPVDASNR